MNLVLGKELRRPRQVFNLISKGWKYISVQTQREVLKTLKKCVEQVITNGTFK